MLPSFCLVSSSCAFLMSRNVLMYNKTQTCFILLFFYCHLHLYYSSTVWEEIRSFYLIPSWERDGERDTFFTSFSPPY